MNEQSIFTDALARTDPAERRAFLDAACGKDAVLRAQVEELLAAGDGGGSFLEHPPAGVDVTIDASLVSKETVNSAVTASSLPYLQPSEQAGRIGKLGAYEIIEVVGQGGMGSVLRAVDTKLSRIVAVKVMAPELAANPTAVRRFLREAQSAAAVVHDHVVTIHAVDDQSRPPYLVMEFIAGQTLQQKIDKEGSLQLKHILRIGSQMAAGLAAAHKTGLIHRDVKPGNILLENGVQRVKITDFGLARAADDVEMTKTGLIAGTPQYMSPEQARGEQIDTRSDLFSLGSVLYAMCTGRPPFRSETTMGTLRRVCEDTPRPIREVNPEIPEWLTATIEKLLAKRPEDRFQTAAEVAELLGQYLAHLQQPGTMPLPATPVVSFTASPTMPPPKEAFRDTPQSSSGLGCVIAICLGILALPILALVLAFGAWFLHHSGTSVQRMNGAISDDLARLSNTSSATLSAMVLDETWTPLFNGTDLSGWKAIPAQNWRVENGVIHGSGADAFLFTEADNFEDFHLALEYRINSSGDSGVHFRAPGPQANKGARWGYAVTGLEAEIGVRPNRNVQTGALTVKDPDLRVLSQSAATPPDSKNWTRLEVIANKEHIQILVNGRLATDYIDRDRKFLLGHIALCSWEGNGIKTAVEFRKVEIKKASQTGTFSSFAVAPFDSQQAAAYQEDCARSLDINVDFTNSLGMKLRLIPPGEFLMGESQEAVDRLVQSLEQGGAGEYDKFVAQMSSPQHKVRITEPFYFGAHEVTVGQYRKFIAKTKYVSSLEQLGVKNRFSWTSSAAEPNPEQRAVIGVSWDDAKAFCKWLSKEEGLAYDLPTEAQWEYACRAGTTTAWSFGDEAAGLQEHTVQGSASFWPAEVVGTKAPNPFGLFDMHGNADEWCLDWHLRNFYAKSPVDDPVCLTDPKEKTSGRVTRGGAGISAPWWTRSTTRAYDYQSAPNTPKGFRVVLLRPQSVGWVKLFNGQDLAGWKVHPFHENKWKVEDGMLVGTGGYSNLFTEKGDFENFELRAEVKVSDEGNSGVMIRSQYGFDFDLSKVGGAGRLPRGMEVDLHPGIQPEHAGSVWHLGQPLWTEMASQQLVKPDQWFTLHVVAKGKQVEVKIDGVTVVEALKNQPSYDQGHITLLQQMKGEGQVWFRKIEVKELRRSPVPKQIANWGRFVDPRGDCRVETKEGKLTLIAPGGRVHDLNPRAAFNKNLDAPRVVREIEGDFLAQVRLEPVPPPLAQTAGHGGASFQGAGLLVWMSDKKFVRLERAAMGETNQGYPYIHVEWFDAGQVVEAQRLVCRTGPTFLQVERRGQQLMLRYGEDGKTWTDAKVVPLELPDSLEIGPVCVNATTKDFAPAFADFQVTTEPEYSFSRFDPVRAEAIKKDALLHLAFEPDSFFQKDSKTFVRDMTGHGNDGECRDVFPDTSGRVGGCMRNDGVGYVRLPRALIANQPAYTVAGWMKWKEPRIKKPAILYNCASSKDPRHNPAFHVWLDRSGQIFCATWHETKDWTDITTSSSQFDRDKQAWIFMAARYGEDEEKGTIQVTLGNQTLARPSHMLKNSTPTNSTDYVALDLIGWIDEVTFWPRKLSDDELHYVQMLGRAGKSLAKD